MHWLLKIFLIISIASSLSATCGNKNIAAGSTAPADSIPQVDDIVNGFMAKYNIPGLSVAIAKDGRLVYVKGYGYANKSTGEKVTPASLFRVASVSKPFTAVAIMQLAESGRLSLNQKVFGDSGILKNDYGTPPYRNDISDITIQELLQHTCGGWSNNMSDPMFTNPGFTASQLISWTLDNVPLTDKPGEEYAYSNFGYCILGRIIEKISGMSYSEFIKTSILQKAGITDMQVGGNTMADKKPNEVVYYGKSGEDPYRYNITRMDSHGGWIASATDLVRFIFCVDGFTTHPDILTASSIKTMSTPSGVNKNYACGWQVNSANNWWHGGSLPGTSSEMVRAGNGFCWAILLNTRTWNPDFGKDMDELIWHAVNDTTIRW